MGFLSAEELNRLLPAETFAYPSPIPTQSVSSDEFMPAPQTAKQREFEARIKEFGGELARRQGMSRRAFFKTAAGMAAAFVAMNETYGELYEASRAEAAIPEMAGERAKAAEEVERRHRHPDLRPAREAEVAVAGEQVAYRLLHGHERGGAGGVDGVGSAH